MSKKPQKQSKPQSSKPKANSETTEMIQGTISRLQAIAAQMEDESLDSKVPMDSLQTLISTAEDLEAAVQKAQQPKAEPVAEEIQPKSESVAETETTIQTDNDNQNVVGNTTQFQSEEENLDKTVAESEDITSAEPEDITSEDKEIKEEQLEDSLPQKESFIRHILPKLAPTIFSKRGLIGIIIVIAVGVILRSGLLFSDKTSEVAEIPVIEEIEEIEEIETPPQLQIPDIPIIKPKPVKNEPKPKLKLNPEQGLIAAIQEQVAQITNEYADGLIISLEANFISSRLIVKASNDWYQLDPELQEEAANEILGRARKLDFKKLEITDLEGKLVARSPVVGQKMIILQ